MGTLTSQAWKTLQDSGNRDRDQSCTDLRSLDLGLVNADTLTEVVSLVLGYPAQLDDPGSCAPCDATEALAGSLPPNHLPTDRHRHLAQAAHRPVPAGGRSFHSWSIDQRSYQTLRHAARRSDVPGTGGPRAERWPREPDRGRQRRLDLALWVEPASRSHTLVPRRTYRATGFSCPCTAGKTTPLRPSRHRPQVTQAPPP